MLSKFSVLSVTHKVYIVKYIHLALPFWPVRYIHAFHTSWEMLSHVWLCATPRTIYISWNSPGQNTGVGTHSLLQGIFPTQGSNPSLLHCRQILYQLSHKESPRILEWIAYSFSSGSSWPGNQARVSCIAGGLGAQELNKGGEKVKKEVKSTNHSEVLVILFYMFKDSEM